MITALEVAKWLNDNRGKFTISLSTTKDPRAQYIQFEFDGAIYVAPNKDQEEGILIKVKEAGK